MIKQETRPIRIIPSIGNAKVTVNRIKADGPAHSKASSSRNDRAPEKYVAGGRPRWHKRTCRAGAAGPRRLVLRRDARAFRCRYWWRTGAHEQVSRDEAPDNCRFRR